MGRCKTAKKGGTNSQRGASPFPSSQDGEEGDTEQDPIQEIVAMEKVLSHLGSFSSRRTSQLPSERSVSTVHQ